MLNNSPYLFCNIGITRILITTFDLPTKAAPTAFINVMVTGGRAVPPCIEELFASLEVKMEICAAWPWPLTLTMTGKVVLKKGDATPISMAPMRVVLALHHETVPLQSETPLVDPYKE